SYNIDDDNKRREHFKWTLGGESRRRIENMLALARNIKPVSDDGADWDTHPWLLAVPNGVVDLRTGVLRPGQPTDRITMSARVAYDPEAPCPKWEAAIAAVFGGDKDLVRYVQLALGYSLTGNTREQCLFLNFGEGANGKTTLINAVAYVLGDYA